VSSISDIRNEEMFDLEISPLGDTSVVVQLGSSIDPETHRKVQILCSYLEQFPFPGMLEIVPAFVTVTICYEPMKLRDPMTGKSWEYHSGSRSPYEMVCDILKRTVSNLDPADGGTSRVITIPVCYGGELGPDLEEVAKRSGLSAEEVIAIHSAPDYLVYMIGFAPGFPYLGGMSERIATPRQHSPRLTIPAGSVGIGGAQTGIYPISTPGGWNLIGRTPLRLFRPDRSSPSLLKAGDFVRFQPISLEQFLKWKEDCT